ncbi:usg protein [Microvirga rosea]|uniref:usg protein n=1 Tax=Microvirga rosea TaxID=2715425 RepID=UPI001D0A907D|nr:usg protein [Microvirga rosea]MCB8823267.1 usg protein [Microvirga rosea]
MTATPDFVLQLQGYGLTTARIFYRIPDHRSLLQEFIWQDYDLFPKFPTLRKFLDYWRRELDGPLFSITVSHSRLIRPAELRAVEGEFRLQ